MLNLHDQPSPDDTQLGYKPLTLDMEKYLPYLDGMDMTDEQKREHLEAVWKIICTIVNDAFDGPRRKPATRE